MFKLDNPAVSKALIHICLVEWPTWGGKGDLFFFLHGLLWLSLLKHAWYSPWFDHVPFFTDCLGISLLSNKNFSWIAVYSFSAPSPVFFKAFDSQAFSTTVNNQYDSHRLVFPFNFWGLLLNIVQLLRRAFPQIVYHGSCYPIGLFILNTQAESIDVSVTNNVYNF